jgi:hypothetical protein
VKVLGALGTIRVRLQVEDIAHPRREAFAEGASHVPGERRDRNADERIVDRGRASAIVLRPRRSDEFVHLIAQLAPYGG